MITQDISVYSSAVKMVDLRYATKHFSGVYSQWLFLHFRALGHVQKEKNGKTSEWQMISFVQSIAHCLEGNKFTSAQKGKTQWWDILCQLKLRRRLNGEMRYARKLRYSLFSAIGAISHNMIVFYPVYI